MTKILYEILQWLEELNIRKYRNLLETDLKIYAGNIRKVLFHPIEVTARTIVQYREHMQITRLLKLFTINRRINSIKCYFDWAKQKGLVQTNYSKSIKFVPTEKTSPKRMSDKEAAALMNTVEKYGTLLDKTMIIFRPHTGLRSMKVCDIQTEDIVMRKRGGHVIVQFRKRNKKRAFPLNSIVRLALEEYITSGDLSQNYLFPSSKIGKRLQERAIRHIFQKYIRLAKLYKSSLIF